MNDLKTWCSHIFLLVVLGLLLPSAVNAERKARFLLPPSGEASLAHWNSKIILNASGDVSSQSILELVSQVAFWTKIARTEVEFILPISGLSSDNTSNEVINYFIYFDDEFPDEKNAKLPEKVSSAAISKFSQDLKELIVGEFFQITKGCRLARRTKENNETLAFVAVIDSSLGNDERFSCIEVAAISSFGLVPNIYQREYTVGPYGRKIIVSDYSEAISLLAAAAACVKDAEELNPQCAATIAGSILGVSVR